MADAKLTITAVDQTRAAFDSVKRGLGDIERTASSLSGIIAGIGAGLSAGALVGFARASIDAADNLGKLSQRVGLAVETLSELQFAGRLADVTTEQLGESLKKLSVNLQEAVGGSREFQRVFAAVGITAADLRTLRTDQAVERIADAFAATRDGAEKTAIAVKIFGRSGSDLIPLLNQGAAGLRAAGDEARRFGLVVSSETAQAAERFNDDMTRLTAQAEALGLALGQRILPALNQVAGATLEAARGGGLLFAALRSVAELGKITLFGVDPTAIEAQRRYINEIRGEISRLEESASGKGALGTGLLDRLVYGDTGQKERKLAELRVTLADAQRALQNLEKARPAPTAIKDALRLPAEAAKAARAQSNALDDAEQAALTLQRQRDREFEATLDALARSREQVQADFLRRFEEGNQLDLEAARDQAQAIERLLAGTRSGQEQGAIRDIEALNQALLVGRIGAEQYEEAYAGIQERLNDIRGIGRTAFSDLARDGSEAFRDLEFAIQGWGRQFTDTLASALETGKLQFSDLVQSVLRDLVRLQIQQSITRPLFNALQGLGAGIFGGPATPAPNQIPYGGARAGGGPVMANTAYMVGERGPELFVPRQGGAILPNGATSSTVNQTFNIAAGVDAGTVYRAASLGAAMAQSNIARQAAIGAM
jgi:hypothetical protein